jgi:hypothetical protein
VPPERGTLFALRRRHGMPQVLSTSGHFSQGHLELRHLDQGPTNTGDGYRISARARGNGGEPTTVYVHVPAAYELAEARIDGRPVQVARHQEGVSKLRVAATEHPVALEITFEGTSEPPAPRAYVAGHPARPLEAGVMP